MVRGAQMFARLLQAARTSAPSTPKAGSTPATSPTWTTRATSASTAGPRTPHPRRRERAGGRDRGAALQAPGGARRGASSATPTSGWANAPAPSSRCARARASTWPASRPRWANARSPSSIGPSASRCSTSCRARPPGRSRSSYCASRPRRSLEAPEKARA